RRGAGGGGGGGRGAARGEPRRQRDPIPPLDRTARGGELPPPAAGVAPPFAHRERHRLERAEVGEQCVDLKGAHEAAFDALLGPEHRDLVGSEKDLSFVGLEHAGDQIDQRGLAGAVRPDQRIALARREIERDTARDDERAEALVQAARRQRRGAHARLRSKKRTSRAAPPRMPFGRKITTATSSVPIQKYQYCGLMPENWSRATM